MNTKQFLASDILERYIAGLASAEEIQEVEVYAQKNPRIAQRIEELNQFLETFAKIYAIESPKHMKWIILSSIRKSDQF